MIVFLILVALALLVTYLKVYHTAHRASSLFAGFPGYPRLPILGNFHLFFGGPEVIFRRVAEISEIIEETNLPFVVYAGPVPVIITNDFDDLKKITTTFVEKPYYYNFTRPWLGNGLITAPVSIWKHNIKKLGGTFKTTIVESYQEMFDCQAAKLVEKLKGEAGAEPFDVLQKYIAYITLEAIYKTGLGVKDVSNSIVTKKYYHAFCETLELLIQRGLNPVLHLDFVYCLTPMYRQLMKHLAVIHNITDEILSKRYTEREEMKQMKTGDQNLDGKSTKFRSYLDILLDLRESDATFTDEQIHADVNTIIVGGQETVATNLQYLLLMLGCHPDVQEKLFAEIKCIYGDSKREVKATDLTQMKYCEAVIYETLRLYPPVPMTLRLADRDLKLKSYTIPKGTGCSINVWGAGRSQRIWGLDAKEFRPERWMEPNSSDYSTIFLAFSYGRRACIGRNYAMALMKTFLARCVRELEFESDAQKLQFKINPVLRAISGHLLQVRLRK